MDYFVRLFLASTQNTEYFCGKTKRAYEKLRKQILLILLMFALIDGKAQTMEPILLTEIDTEETDALLTMLQSRYGYDAIPRDKIDSIRLERDSLYAVTRPNGITYSNNLLCDTALVTPEFLIQHIDNAFEVMASYRDVSQRTVRMVNI